MKSLKIIFCLFFLCLNLQAQKIRIKDIWRQKKGDFASSDLLEVQNKLKLHLKYNEAVVIELDKLEADSNALSYRILGVKNYDYWRFLGDVSTLQFPILAGGNYILEIRYGDNGSILKLNVIVQQTFWQEWWFWPSIVFYVLCLLGIAAYFFFIYNLRQKLKVQEIRNRIAADLHDEVGSNLSSIAIFVELLRKKAPKDLTPILDKITSNSKESVQLMQDTIWAIQTKNDDFQKFIDKMKDFSRTVLSAKNISLNFECQISSNKNMLTMDQRKNAYLIFKESINNIAKHANASKANVKIWQENELIFIEILDNGQGFDTKLSFQGNGLINFKERAAECDMNIDINSQINKGTSILMSITTD